MNRIAEDFKQPSYGRRVGDQWNAGARRALLALGDAGLAGQLARLFAEADVLPTLAFSCQHLLSEARQGSYGLIVVDQRLACDHDSRCFHQVRSTSTVPIVALGDVEDLEHTEIEVIVDAEWDLAEVAKRGSALIDMSRPVRLPAPVRWGPLELDMGRHEARWRGHALHLSTLQFRIMEVLAMAAGSVVSVEQLSNRVWGDDSVGDRDRLVAHVRRIRRKIEEDPSNPRFLLRVRGTGFRLAEPTACDDSDGHAQRPEDRSQ